MLFGGSGPDSGRFGAWESLQATDPDASRTEELPYAAGCVASRSGALGCRLGLTCPPLQRYVRGQVAFEPDLTPLSAWWVEEPLFGRIFTFLPQAAHGFFLTIRGPQPGHGWLLSRP